MAQRKAPAPIGSADVASGARELEQKRERVHQQSSHGGRMNHHARLAELYRELAEAHERLARAHGDEFVAQDASPLGARLHCRLVHSGQIPGYRAGRRILVRRADLDAYLERHRVQPIEPVDTDDQDERFTRHHRRREGRLMGRARTRTTEFRDGRWLVKLTVDLRGGGTERRTIELPRGTTESEAEQRIRQSTDERGRKVREFTKSHSVRLFRIEPALRPVLVARALESGGQGRLFGSVADAPGELRAHLLRAGVTRTALHKATAWKLALRFHDLRATGIT